MLTHWESTTVLRVELFVRNEEVRSSNLLCSTTATVVFSDERLQGLEWIEAL